MKKKVAATLLCGVVLWALLAIWGQVTLLYAHSVADSVSKEDSHICTRLCNKTNNVPSSFNPTMNLAGVLAPGMQGLFGEQISWVVAVTNSGPVSGVDVVITDTLRDEMRVNWVVAQPGKVSIDEQKVTVTLSQLNPGETAHIVIYTTVVRDAVNGVLANQAQLVANSSDTEIVRKTAACITVPTNFLATSYPPASNWLGIGEFSVREVGFVVCGVVALTALLVWSRGQ